MEIDGSYIIYDVNTLRVCLAEGEWEECWTSFCSENCHMYIRVSQAHAGDLQ